jgi:plasmid stabilization system protein ParE
MEIEWSTFALNQLAFAYQYYFMNAGVVVAEKVTNEIFLSVEILINHPFAGQEEEILKSHGKHFRYLVTGNYKIIYSVSKTTIIIHDVFDTRLNPKKLVKRNK